jgi:hypothetical protein
MNKTTVKSKMVFYTLIFEICELEANVLTVVC